jgi:hypothetical protein
VILVDDHFIAHRLATGRHRAGSEDLTTSVATTCSWWWRLSAAVAGTRGGVLSRYFGGVGSGAPSALQRTIARLPEMILMLDLRELIPAMALLSAEYELNLLAAEAVAAAEVLGADLVLRQETPRIREAAAARSILYRLDS